MNKNNERTVLIVGGVIIGLVVGYVLFRTPVPAPTDQADTTATSTATSSAQMMQDNSSFAVHANNQPAGLGVTIAVETKNPVWIAIREVDEDGNPSAILGAHLFAETATDTIDLLRQTIPDTTYAVSAYEDNGNRIFEFKGNDMPIRAKDGSEKLVTFITYPTSPR